MDARGAAHRLWCPPGAWSGYTPPYTRRHPKPEASAVSYGLLVCYYTPSCSDLSSGRAGTHLAHLRVAPPPLHDMEPSAGTNAKGKRKGGQGGPLNADPSAKKKPPKASDDDAEEVVVEPNDGSANDDEHPAKAPGSDDDPARQDEHPDDKDATRARRCRPLRPPARPYRSAA